jgi:septum formation protein
MMLYLASTSPRRRELLKQLGIEFHVLKPDTNEAEHTSGSRSPRAAAIACARAKARSAAHKARSGWVVGVDTIVVLDGEIMGKPGNRAEARRMLSRLSGRTHEVTSGVAVLRRPQDRLLASAETTRVSFRTLTAGEVERYIATREPYDKAGAYGIQERAGVFVRRVDGCYLNVIGLPVPLLLRLLHRSGWRSA